MRVAPYLAVTLLLTACSARPPAPAVRPINAAVLETPASSGPDLKAIIEAEFPDLERLYTTIHTNPELSLNEEKTAARLADELRKAGYKVTERVGRTGVVAVLENGPGKTLLLRTELDALPVVEQTGAPYASKATTQNAKGDTVGVMHACGHDIHITSLVGTARALASLKDHWHGTLVLVGQPAEELVVGAKNMLNDRLYARFPKPDYCLALHVDSELQVGTVGFIPGYAFAHSDAVEIVIRGVGGHGAMPHLTKDPIVIAAQTILALQTIASRETRAIDPVVVTVGSIHGGTKGNVIPDEVKLELTVRTYKDTVRERTLKAIERICNGIARAAGVPDDRMPTMKLVGESNPSTYNTPEFVARVTDVFRQTIGAENVIQRDPTMGAEDFGRFGTSGDAKIPLFMYRLGSISAERIAESKREGGKPLPSLHSSHYLPDRSAIKTGVATMAAAALDLLK